MGASFSRFRGLRFRVLSASFSRFWGLRFRVLGASFSRFGCFVLRSSFSSASFSKLLGFKVGGIDIGRAGDFLAFGGIGVVG